MQDRKGCRAHALEAAITVEVADDRDDTAMAQPSNVLRPSGEAIEPDSAPQQLGRAQSDVAAADQQYPYHSRAQRETTLVADSAMPLQITIKPSAHSFACDEGETVLAAAMRADLMIPYGCRNGACGSCKGKILDGEVDYGVHQPATLTDAEKAQRLALFCVARPKTSLVIEVREVRRAGDIQIRKLPCRIEKIDKVAPDVAIVSLKLPANERLQYLAGQYIDLLLKDGRRRSFSIATPPEADALLELHIRHLPGGFFSDALFNEYKGREILRFEGPLGTFYLREESHKPLIFVAGGTGFAPIKAVIEHALHHALQRPIALYWGVRSLRDLYLPDLPQRWQAQHRNFRFIPVLSDPLPEDRWSGRTGLVHKAVMADFPDLTGYQAYACGGPAMISAAKQDFTAERGLPVAEFFADSFTYAVEPQPPVS
jgi:CDP-4-dehydro-6-deoxyglucose reductase